MKILKILNITALNVWFYFWAPFVVTACLLIFIPFVSIVQIFKPKRAMHYFRRSINIYGKAVTLTAWPWIRVKLNNAPSLNNAPYIFVENHTSSFDPFVQGFLPYEIVQSARGWALRFPVLGRFARWAGYIDVESAGTQILEKAKILLKNNVTLVFFPEGTRHTDGLLGGFHGVAFRIAIETSTPIVPLIISGISNKPSKGSFIMHPGMITMTCLPVIQAEEFQDKTSFALKKEVRKIMECASGINTGNKNDSEI